MIYIVVGGFKWLGKSMSKTIKPPLVLSEKGKKEYKKILKFKYYLDEYTLIKSKEMESVVLWDWYIPYSIAIGSNKGFKKDIEQMCKDLNIEAVMLNVFEYELNRNYIV